MRTFIPYAFAFNLLIAGSALALDSKVHSETDVERHADGSYEGTSKHESTDAAGTTTKSRVEEKEMVGSGGKTKSYSKVEASADPKGLGNKTWSEKETQVSADAKGNMNKDTYAKSVDAAGTTRKMEDEVETKLRADGSAETKITQERVTDPKGLFNKSTSTTEEVVRKNADGSTTKSVKKDVDGKTVENTIR